jgi:hypothetical protein
LSSDPRHVHNIERGALSAIEVMGLLNIVPVMQQTLKTKHQQTDVVALFMVQTLVDVHLALAL